MFKVVSNCFYIYAEYRCEKNVQKGVQISLMVIIKMLYITMYNLFYNENSSSEQDVLKLQLITKLILFFAKYK